MADTSTIPKCAACHKTDSGSGNPLKRCAKCQTTSYCSRECQKADWKNHKKVCASNTAGSTKAAVSSSTSTSGGQASKGLTAVIDKPFHHLNDKTWLHNRPENDVFKLLIDTYRFRMEDNFTLEGDRDRDSVYGGAADGRVGFQRFLRLAEVKDGLLPSWWSKEKGDECVALGLSNGPWSSLAKKVTKSELIQHYGNSLMPMQLRLFGEQVYGRGPGGQSGEMIIMMQMQAEKPGVLESSVVDASSMFGRR
jgi:splicing suppressor protein 51